ncbi:MAG TPA: FixH family protein [Gemmatimonadaceae bacterium]|nr:FixH family protein [Gemmatimonadaceae bacterium]
MKKGAMWPVGIAAILALTMAANFGVMYIAGNDPSFAIEKDYYAKAVGWDAQMAQERHNAELGWRLVPDVSPIDSAGALVSVRLTDAAGTPLDGATLRVHALHNARASDILEGTLAERADREYAARLPMHRAGQWELRFEATRDGQRFTAVRRVDVAREREGT